MKMIRMRFGKKKDVNNDLPTLQGDYGFMHVLDMSARIVSLSLTDGNVVAVATFRPMKPITINPGDAITLKGADGVVVYQTIETVSKRIDLMLGDSLELTIKLKPHGIMDVERWVLM